MDIFEVPVVVEIFSKHMASWEAENSDQADILVMKDLWNASEIICKYTIKHARTIKFRKRKQFVVRRTLAA